MASALLRISSLSIGFVILAVLSVGNTRAFAANDSEEVIEAKVYDIRTIRPSRSGRVYLFEKFDSDLPVDGKIFLVRNGAEPIMALRVLKTYPATQRIAAKKLRSYPGHEILPRGSNYRAFEKTGDRMVAPVPPTPEDLQDLRELEELPPAPMEEESAVDAEPSSPPQLEEEVVLPAEEPPPEPMDEIPPAETLAEIPPVSDEAAAPDEDVPSEDSTPEQVERVAESNFTDEDLELKTVEETTENDLYYPNQISFVAGMLPNKKIPGPASKFGGGLLYSRGIGPRLAVEGGIYYYKSTDSETGISMTVTPLVGNLRYHYVLNPIWTLYGYGGFIFPRVANQVGASTKLLREVQVLTPALGVGAFIQTGPNWYVRLNFGIDSLTAGAALRF